MSQENVKIVRSGYEAFNQGDREAWLASLDPGVELVFPFMDLDGHGPAYGHAGAEQTWDTWRATFTNASFEVVAIRDLGDTVLVALRVHGLGAGSEVPIEQRSWQVVSLRDGRIIRVEAFLREAEALEAAELSR